MARVADLTRHHWQGRWHSQGGYHSYDRCIPIVATTWSSQTSSGTGRGNSAAADRTPQRPMRPRLCPDAGPAPYSGQESLVSRCCLAVRRTERVPCGLDELPPRATAPPTEYGTWPFSRASPASCASTPPANSPPSCCRSCRPDRRPPRTSPRPPAPATVPQGDRCSAWTARWCPPATEEPWPPPARTTATRPDEKLEDPARLPSQRRRRPPRHARYRPPVQPHPRRMTSKQAGQPTCP